MTLTRHRGAPNRTSMKQRPQQGLQHTRERIGAASHLAIRTMLRDCHDALSERI